MAKDPTRTAYDEVPYPSYAMPQTHPDRLAAIAVLFGQAPAPVDRCRILEIGCGDGTNILPMALAMPDSDIVGIDLARTAVERGQATIKALGLGNIRLLSLDLMALTKRYGKFDYIIAHGFYSWVPPPVRDRLMATFRSHLSERGIGYVSYNTLPGGYVRRMVRDMLLYHAAGEGRPRARVAAGRELLSFMAEAMTAAPAAEPSLREEVEAMLARRHEDVLLHDDMAPVNAPVYFHELASHAARHGLAVLGEADFFEMQDHYLPASVRRSLAAFTARDFERREQYLDFIKCRRFRQTLVCHEGAKIDRATRPEWIASLLASTNAVADGESPGRAATAVASYTTPAGGRMRTRDPVTKAAMRSLIAAAPKRLTFAELLSEIRKRLRSKLPGEPERALASALFGALSAGAIQLHTFFPALASAAGSRPHASALARQQLREGREVVTSLLHTNVGVSAPLERRLLALLDGTRDRVALSRLTREGGAGVDEALERFAQVGLLLE